MPVAIYTSAHRFARFEIGKNVLEPRVAKRLPIEGGQRLSDQKPKLGSRDPGRLKDRVIELE